MNLIKISCSFGLFYFFCPSI